METIKEMRERHKREVEELQSKCEHKSQKWMPYMWNLEHFFGEVLVCTICDKILHQKHSTTIVTGYPKNVEFK